MLYTAILVLHIIVAISMIGLILIQHGKGADAGASFGAGGAGTVFGGNGVRPIFYPSHRGAYGDIFYYQLKLGCVCQETISW